MALDIHDYKLRLEQELRYLEKSKLSEANKATLRRFHDDCVVQGLSKPRICKLMEVVRQQAGWLRVDLEKAGIDDIKHLVTQIENRPYTPWTKSTHKVILKKFYKWLRALENGDFPPEVRWIKTAPKAKDIKMINDKELITPEEIQKAIDVCDHPRSKAFISVLTESGCRIGEIGTLMVKNVTFDEQGVILTVNGKTGSRRIRIVQSMRYLRAWMDCHPFRDNLEAAVWVNIGTNNYRKPTMYPTMCKLIRDAFRKAGVRKRVNPHIFRHSRASILANHLTEFQMNHYFGWTQGSTMPSTYVHLTGKDLDKAILKLNVDSVQKLDASVEDSISHKTTNIIQSEAPPRLPMEDMLRVLLQDERIKKILTEAMNL
jgi:integrase